MGGLFGKPKVSKPKPVKISRPAEEDKAGKQRAMEDEEARRKRANLASNILAGGETAGPATGPAIQQKKLLGE